VCLTLSRRSSKMLHGRNFTLVKRHIRRNVGWTYRVGQNVAWSFFGRMYHQDTIWDEIYQGLIVERIISATKRGATPEQPKSSCFYKYWRASLRNN
jgi:hypothetical protein